MTRVCLTQDLHLTVGVAPWDTIQHTLDYVFGQVDLGIYDAHIVAPKGVYNESLLVNGPQVGTGKVYLWGDGDGGTLLTWDGSNNRATFELWGARMYVGGLDIQHTGTQDAFHVTRNAYLQVGKNVRFGKTGFAHLDVDFNSNLMILDDYSVMGGAQFHMTSTLGGVITVYGGNCSVINQPGFLKSFVLASENGTVQLKDNTYSGLAHGQRYIAKTNGIIQTFRGNQLLLPGSIPGYADWNTGGRYT